MPKYTPHGWVIFQHTIDGKQEHYVFGSWRGGYLDGDSWRRNSGIKSVEETDDEYLFHGYSGSVYCCRKDSEGELSGYNAMILQRMLEANKGSEVIQYTDMELEA